MFGVLTNTKIYCLKVVAHQLQYSLVKYRYSFEMSLSQSGRTIRNLNSLTAPASVWDNSLLKVFSHFREAWSTRCQFTILGLTVYCQVFLMENIWRNLFSPSSFSFLIWFKLRGHPLLHLGELVWKKDRLQGGKEHRQPRPSSSCSRSNTEMQAVVDRVWMVIKYNENTV